nr:hypothetical protein [Myxococcales bacterium]
LAFALAARAAGKRVSIVNDDPCPSRYAWMDPDKDLGDFDNDARSLQGADLGLIFDANELSRARRPAAQLIATGCDVWVFDHHRLAPDSAISGCVATEFSSTGELCFRLLQALQWTVPAAAAAAIYSAISFDTGSFRFLRNQANTLEVAAELLATGIDTNPIQEALWANRPFDETILLGRIVSSIERRAAGKVAWVVVRPEMLKGLSLGPGAAGEAMPSVIGIEGVLVAAMVKPGRKPQEWKVSFRSKTAAKIGHIASARGGGGHAHAAGCTMQGPIDSWIGPLLIELDQAAQ